MKGLVQVADSKKKIVRSTREKTNVYVDSGLWREARHYRADSEKNLSMIMEEALALYLNITLVEELKDAETADKGHVDSRKVSGRRHN